MDVDRLKWGCTYPEAIACELQRGLTLNPALSEQICVQMGI